MPYKDLDKQREYQRQWFKSRRDEFFSNKFCTWCGSVSKLVLHHVNPSEKESHNIWSWSNERRDREIQKCIVLCERCHKDYHARIASKFIHGTLTMYNKHGCRCDKCRDAIKLQARKYRSRLRSLTG